MLKDAEFEFKQDELNFSSELEIDERFENAEEKFHEADTHVIDRSQPEGLRMPVKGVRAENKRKIFESYHAIVEREAAEQAKNKRFVKFDQSVNIMKHKSMAQVKKNVRDRYFTESTQQKVINILTKADLY